MMEEVCVCVVAGYKESNEQNAILRSDTAASEKQGSLSCTCERRERRHNTIWQRDIFGVAILSRAVCGSEMIARHLITTENF